MGARKMALAALLTIRFLRESWQSMPKNPYFPGKYAYFTGKVCGFVEEHTYITLKCG
jgi:hypothetical protein